MGDAVREGDPRLEAEEARLARAAAAGDGEAFATLYERYSQRAYNLSLRICGAEDDAADAVQEAFVSVIRRLKDMEAERELAFGSYLFTATRNATYDLLRRAQRMRPSEEIAESAVPLGAGAGGLGLDPGDPEEDPSRRQLLRSQQEEVRAANARLPERQREALALRELEELSYDEIAEIMEMNRNSAAQLISRARINLRDELRGTALAAIAASSPDCERALPLIAMKDDGQLLAGGEDAVWLQSHLASCGRCRAGREAMQEAGVSYRGWVPVAAAPGLLEATMARAADRLGFEWSEEISRAARRARGERSTVGLPRAYRESGTERRRGRRRLALGVGALATLAIVVGFAERLGAGDRAPAPAARLETVAKESREPLRKEGKRERRSRTQRATLPAEPLASAPAAAAPAAPEEAAPEDGARESGEAEVRGPKTRHPSTTRQSAPTDVPEGKPAQQGVTPQPPAPPPQEPAPVPPPASEEERPTSPPPAPPPVPPQEELPLKTPGGGGGSGPPVP